MSEFESKSGHPVLGIVLGILGILIALLLTLIAGVIAGGLALLLGVIAVLLGVFARKGSSRGMGAIVTGAIAIVAAVVMTVSSVSLYTQIRNEAAKYEQEAPLVVKSLDNPYLGVVGMIMNMPKDEGSVQQLTDQFNLINEKIKANPAK